MLWSRGSPLLKSIVTGAVAKNVLKKVPSRSSHYECFYRQVPDPPKFEIIGAEILGGFMWWWILWNMYHDIGHVIGEYDIPDPLKWTDEELGIPPED